MKATPNKNAYKKTSGVYTCSECPKDTCEVFTDSRGAVFIVEEETDRAPSVVRLTRDDAIKLFEQLKEGLQL